jgi:hypothetical protein
MPTLPGGGGSGRRQSFIEGLLQKHQNDDDREQSEPRLDDLHALPDGIYSIEAMRFPNLYLGALRNPSHAATGRHTFGE